MMGLMYAFLAFNSYLSILRAGIPSIGAALAAKPHLIEQNARIAELSFPFLRLIS